MEKLLIVMIVAFGIYRVAPSFLGGYASQTSSNVNEAVSSTNSTTAYPESRQFICDGHQHSS